MSKVMIRADNKQKTFNNVSLTKQAFIEDVIGIFNEGLKAQTSYHYTGKALRTILEEFDFNDFNCSELQESNMSDWQIITESQV